MQANPIIKTRLNIEKHSTMKKKLTTLALFSAALFTVQAQQKAGGISPDMLQDIQKSYVETPAERAIRNAIAQNDIRKLTLNLDNQKSTPNSPSELNPKASPTNNPVDDAGFLPG